MAKISIVRRRLESRVPTESPPESRSNGGSPPFRNVLRASFGGQGSRLLNNPALLFEIPSQDAHQIQALAQKNQRGENELSATLHKEGSLLVLRIQAPHPGRKLISCGKVADILGMSRAYVYHLAHQGELPTYRIGRILRFDPADVLDFLAKRLDESGGTLCI